MSLGMLCALWSIHNMENYDCKMRPNITHLFLENMNETKGWGKKSQQYFGTNCIYNLRPI